MSGHRRPSGGKIIERTRTVTFSFDGKRYFGLGGDTLASALIAGGVVLVGRSSRLHRPRGILAAGMEEPNALVTVLGGDGRRTPNVPATELEIFDGLACESQNRYPSLDFDMLAAGRALGDIAVAGAEYRSWTGPALAWAGRARPWTAYGRRLRRLAGLGTAGTAADPADCGRMHAFCDTLVVGSGKPGIAAALTAARRGRRVIVCEADATLGGHASWSGDPDISAMVTELSAMDNVRLLARTTVWDALDGEGFAALERVGDHRPGGETGAPRQRHWTIRAEHVALATGAVERPLIFAGNDVPGVMLASAAQRYAGMYGALPGKRIVIATNNDSAYATAIALKARDANIVAIVDLRPDVSDAARTMAAVAGARLRSGHAVLAAAGTTELEAATVAPYRLKTRQRSGTAEDIACDCLLMSGGWSPALDLAVQMGARPVWTDRLQAYVAPHRGPHFSLHGAADGDLDFGDGLSAVPAPIIEVTRGPTAFVDFQQDLTPDDIRRAARQGFVTTAQLRRYNGLGMGTDRGRTGRAAAHTALAHARGMPVGEAPPPDWRPPVAGIALAALAGGAAGTEAGAQVTPMHDWHIKNGAPMRRVGGWRRPVSYNRWNEKSGPASLREVRITRSAAGICDVSALGKIDVRGPDALTLLDRIFATDLRSLGTGRTRFGVMLRDDGIVFQTAFVWRLADRHFMVTTSPAAAGAILDHIEFHNACSWPDLRAHVTDVTDQWAAAALAGPRARAVLEACVVDTDVDTHALPMGGVVHGRIAAIPAMIARISRTGELGFEVHCGAGHGARLWDGLLAAGEAHGLAPFGDVAMETLRIEKGRVDAPEIDGRATARDLNLDRYVSDQDDFIGAAMMDRLGLVQTGRPTLVGVIARGGEAIHDGGHLVEAADRRKPGPSLGRLTSTCFSPHVGCYIGLAALAEGRTRIGGSLFAADPARGGDQVQVEIVRHNMIDPAGARMHG